MITIAICSQKGGAGKTTLAIHLAVEAMLAKKVTLILDADPQATASKWGMWRSGADPEVIDCASPPLLATRLAKAAVLGAEVAIIDTPPHADIMAREACKIADLILIPCRPRAFDLDAIQTTAGLALASGKPAFVVFTAGPARAALLYPEATGIVREFGLEAAPMVMADRAIYHHSTASGRAAQEVESEGKAAQEVAALWQWAFARANPLTRKHVNKLARKVAA